jgi:hypothetical protein
MFGRLAEGCSAVFLEYFHFFSKKYLAKQKPLANFVNPIVFLKTAHLTLAPTPWGTPLTCTGYLRLRKLFGASY